jgi:uncharacterized protein YndB with AHSA1/START domain
MPAIRQQINVAASPRAVWNALTTAEGLTAWWVDEARVDPRTGGRVVVASVGEDGAPSEQRGLFLDFRPTRRVEIAWDTLGGGGKTGQRIEFQVAMAGGETRVSVVVSGGEALDDEEAHAALSRDWKASLKALRAHLEAA